MGDLRGLTRKQERDFLQGHVDRTGGMAADCQREAFY